jgi:hypothetical protein
VTTAAAKKKAEKAPEPVTTTEFTFDGVRAIDTITDADGNVSTVAREATFEEQIGVLASQVLDQAVGIVHLADSGTVETKGNTITITLAPR